MTDRIVTRITVTAEHSDGSVLQFQADNPLHPEIDATIPLRLEPVRLPRDSYIPHDPLPSVRVSFDAGLHDPIRTEWSSLPLPDVLRAYQEITGLNWKQAVDQAAAGAPPMDSHNLWHEADAIVCRLRDAADAVDADCTERHRDMLGPLAKAHEEIIALVRKYAQPDASIREWAGRALAAENVTGCGDFESGRVSVLTELVEKLSPAAAVPRR